MLIEADGFRLVTDPTFDAPGEYQLSYVTLTKTSGPASSADRIGPVDAVLISHDQHSDNLDHSGRAFAAKARACSPRWPAPPAWADLPKD
jgi:L-ascorbate metabolism protein UlaG (beta-lactamase superfamily)